MKLLAIQYAFSLVAMGAGIYVSRFAVGFIQRIIVLNAVTAAAHILLMSALYFLFLRKVSS